MFIIIIKNTNANFVLNNSMLCFHRYQFNPIYFQAHVVAQILLKALTNLPHTDLTLCKCLIDATKLEEEPLVRIMQIAEVLETCQFRQFWVSFLCENMYMYVRNRIEKPYEHEHLQVHGWYLHTFQ